MKKVVLFALVVILASFNSFGQSYDMTKEEKEKYKIDKDLRKDMLKSGRQVEFNYAVMEEFPVDEIDSYPEAFIVRLGNIFSWNIGPKTFDMQSAVKLVDGQASGTMSGIKVVYKPEVGQKKSVVKIDFDYIEGTHTWTDQAKVKDKNNKRDKRDRATADAFWSDDFKHCVVIVTDPMVTRYKGKRTVTRDKKMFISKDITEDILKQLILKHFPGSECQILGDCDAIYNEDGSVKKKN